MRIIKEIGDVILFKGNMAEEDICLGHTFRSLDCIFLFVRTFYTVHDSKGKKRINKALSMKSKQFLSLFHFLV